MKGKTGGGEGGSLQINGLKLEEPSIVVVGVQHIKYVDGSKPMDTPICKTSIGLVQSKETLKSDF